MRLDKKSWIRDKGTICNVASACNPVMQKVVKVVINATQLEVDVMPQPLTKLRAKITLLKTCQWHKVRNQGPIALEQF